MFITNAVLENLPRNRNNFVNKTNIFLGPFLFNFVRLKTWDKLSVNIDHVYCMYTLLIVGLLLIHI